MSVLARIDGLAAIAVPRMPVRRQRVLGSAWVAVAQAVSLLAAFLLLKLVATMSTAPRFGVFSLVLAMAGASATLVFGPLGQWAIRHYQESLERDTLTSYYLAAGVAAAIGSAALLAVTLPVLFARGFLARLDMSPVLVVLGLAVGIVGGLGDICVFIANAAMRRALAGVLLVVQSTLRPLAVLAAWFLGGRSATAWATAIVAACGVFLLLEIALVIRRDIHAFSRRSRITRGHLSGLWAYTAPFFVWGVPSYAVSFGDRLIVGYLAGAAVVAQYVALTVATTSVANGFDATINRIFEPVVFRRAGDASDPRRVKAADRLVNFAAGVGLVSAGLLALLVWAWPEFIVRAFTSARYASAAGDLWLLALSGIALLVGRQFILRGLIRKRPWVYLPAKLAHAASLVAFLLTLVPRHGIGGACLAVLLAQVLQFGIVIATNRVVLRRSWA